MPGPDWRLLAYGPGPPIDLIPYFLGLAAWVGFAVIAILLSPLTALLRFLRKKKTTNHTNNTNKEQINPADDQPSAS